MFRHPQLAALEQRKWDLVAKSSSLRDDLQVELVYWQKISKWIDAGASVLRLIGGYRTGAVGVLGILAAWMFKKGFSKASQENISSATGKSKGALDKVLMVTRNVLLGWKLFNQAKSLYRSYCVSKRSET